MNWYLVVAGFLVHLIFFYSIFDIYFSSPLVHGMTPQHSSLPASAKRIVLFVADGLRADRLFELDDRGETRAPFLRNKILHEGSWGVSHTRVPTESRPGHVAIIAGFYEDVSAVTKGWKENPVEFDSVFNESRMTWSWGSPDILPMFAKGATGDHVHMHMYPGHNEDFAGATLSNLDMWVFDQVTEFLESSKWNDTVRQLLSQDKLVFFLHLLGLDTNGHAHRPYSYEYLENIRIVDEGLSRIVRLFDEIFDYDGKTAYVFTADHGMTNWGSHGAGDPSETLTPLVAWGAGVRSAQHVDDTSRYDSPEEWKLNDLKRSDVNQADICPLMATLVGVPIPLQSVGTVPLEYLNSSGLFKANAFFSNAKQILEQFKIKRQQRLDSTLSVLHQPFKSLSATVEADEVRQIQQLIQAQQFDDAIVKSRQLIDLALEGLSYYHNYDRFMLGASIACSFIGWMAYIVTLVLEQHTDIVVNRSTAQRTSGTLIVSFGLLGLAVAAFLLVQSQHWTYYIYLELPVLLWFKTLQRFDVLHQAVDYILTNGLLLKAAIVAGLGFAGLEIIILSFFYRELLTVGFLFLAVWSLASPPTSARKDVIKRWCLSLVLMAVFPMLPVVGRSANYALVYIAGFLAVVVVIYRTYICLKSSSAQGTTLFEVCRQPPVIFTVFQILVLLTSVYVVWRTAVSLGGNTGLSVINQCLSWAILVSAFFLPLLSESRVVQRLTAIELAFLPSYLLLSTSHEGLFYVGLCLLMMCWLQLESQQMSSTPSPNPSDTLERLDFAESTTLDQLPRKLVPGDLRCAYFFIFFLLSAFFGTGNIASINSFDPTSVLCFVTVFNPFVMGSLMLWKILIPFLVVTCTFNAIHVAINVPTQSLFFLVLLMSDFMALHFFFLVRDYGSWLDIGMSISHYVIVMAMICFLFLLLTLSKFFTDFSLRLQAYRPSLSRSKPHRL